MIDFHMIRGGLVDSPELRFTPSGQAVAQFRLAQSTSKKDDTGQWVNDKNLYVPVSLWNENPQYKQNPIPWAELAAGLAKGDRVAVYGRWVTRSWEAKDGTRMSRIEFEANALYVEVTKLSVGVTQQAGTGWNTPANTGGSSPTMQQAQQAVQQTLGGDDQPPF